MSSLSTSTLPILSLIPHEELSQFKREKQGAQQEVLKWLGIINEINNAGKGQKGDIVAAISRRISVGKSTVNRKLSDFNAIGWSALINRAKFPEPNSIGLPAAFESWIPTLYSRYQRRNAAKQIHRYLLDRLAKWRATLNPEHKIPGYDSPPTDTGHGYPEGWSYRQICRLKPQTINLITSRQGKKAASSLLPSNYTTRYGLKFGQRIFFDDQHYDLKVNLLGQNTRAMRPLGFNALDHLSASFIDYTAKMTLWDDGESRSRELKQKDFTWFSIKTLLDTGYRNDAVGTEHIYEHGTASSYKGFEDALYHSTGGKVTVSRSGRFNDPIFSGMLFRPQSAGNFRYKAPLESIFNLVRNQMAALPGPTGQHFSLSPEELNGMDAYNRQLLKLYTQLPEARRELIKFPVLSWPEFSALLPEIYQLIDARTDHQLEGWERCEFIANRFRLAPDQPWQDRDTLRNLSADRAQAISDLAEWRLFALSPAQVRAQHIGELTKLNPSLVPHLVPFEWALDVTVKNGEIHIRDKEAGGETFIYLAQFQTPTGHETIKHGTELKALYHPITSDRIWLLSPAGEYLGTVDQFIKPTAGDTPSIIENQGRINSIAADHNRWTERYLGAVPRERKEMVTHNKRLANDEETDPQERLSNTAKKAAFTRTKNETADKPSRTGTTLEDLI